MITNGVEDTLSAAGHYTQEAVQADVAATERDSHPFAPSVNLAGQEGGQGRRPTRLDHDLKPFKQKRHRLPDLIVGDERDLPNMAAGNGPGQLARRLGLLTVSDGD